MTTHSITECDDAMCPEHAAICPHCGRITDDVAGGPCSQCWEKVGEADDEMGFFD